MNEKKTFVLTGFMGSGKSTVGRLLSDRLRIPYLDLDEVIVRGEKKSIPEIFSQKGEEYFREQEHRCLSQIIDGPTVVLSLGGGALQSKCNLDLIRQKSIIIYLEVPAEELYQRLKHDSNRPLLRNAEGRLPGESELRQRIESLLEERDASYRQADLTIRIHPEWNIIETTNEVIRVLSEYAPAALTIHH